MKPIRLKTLMTRISKRLRRIPKTIQNLEIEQARLEMHLRTLEIQMGLKKEPYVKEVK